MYDLPAAIALEPHIGLMERLVADFSFFRTRLHMRQVARDGGVSPGTDLYVHVGNLIRLDSPSIPNKSSPLLFVLWRISSSFGKPFCEIGSVIRKIVWKIVGRADGIILFPDQRSFFQLWIAARQTVWRIRRWL